MQRGKDRLEKFTEAIGFGLGRGSRTVQAGSVLIRLLEFVGKQGGAFERLIHRVALRMLLVANGKKRLTIESEGGAHPACRERPGCPVNEDKAGEVAVGREDLERSIHAEPPGGTRGNSKREMGARKLNIHLRIAVDLAGNDVFQSAASAQGPVPGGFTGLVGVSARSFLAAASRIRVMREAKRGASTAKPAREMPAAARTR